MKQILSVGRVAVPFGMVISAWLFTACGPRSDIARGVQIVTSSATLEATTTFEVRFDQPVIGARDVGLVEGASPLVIDPPLAGRFQWRSVRSGVFTPAEPMQLGRAYRFRLRADLPNDSGRPVGARLDRTFLAPPFSVVTIEPQAFRGASLPARPELCLQFNAPIAAEVAQGFCEFRSPDGGRVPARVTQGTVAQVIDSWNRGAGFSPLGWEERFAAATNSSPAATGEVVVSENDFPPRPNLLVVTPLRPLPVGSNWTMVVARGLPSADRRHRTAAEWSAMLGDVERFCVRSCAPENGLKAGRRVELRLSKPLASDIDPTNAAQWFSVSPQPKNLRFDARGSHVVIHGDFSLDRLYALRVLPGLPAAESPFRLDQAFTNHVRFDPLPPRLYLPAYETAQLSDGRRAMELLAVNVNAVRLRVRQLDRHTLIHALRGYRKYFKNWDEDDVRDEPHREVDFDLVPGRLIAERVIQLTNRVDETERLQWRWDDLLGAAAHGAVFLSAEVDRANAPAITNTFRRLGTQCLVQLTDLGLLWKTTAGEATVLVFSHHSGAPVAGAAVRLLDGDNQTLAEVLTDASGCARLASETNAHWLLAELGDDLHAERLDGRQLSAYGFGFDVENWPQPGREREVLLFSDRPVYRPGDAVHLKAIVRDWQRDGLTVPRGLSGTLRCFDARDDKFLETNLVLSALGTAEQTILLPERGRGAWRVELQFGERQYSHAFRVEDYEPEAFELKIGAQPAYAAEEPVAVPVSARYLMGRPVSRARVRWSAMILRHDFVPPGLAGFRFGAQVDDFRLLPDYSPTSPCGEIVLHEATNFVIHPGLAPQESASGPVRVSFSVEMTDPSQKSVRREIEFIRHCAAFYLGVRLPSEVLRAGETLPLQLIAVQANGAPRSDPVKVTATLRRVEWLTVRTLQAGLVPGYRSDPQMTNIASVELVSHRVRQGTNGWDVVPPNETVPVLIPPSPGQYLLELRAKDEAGRPVVTTVSLAVSGRDAVAWDYRNPAQIQLQPDRAAYSPGDTARLLVKTPIGGHALVTVERDQVRRSFVTQLAGNAPEIRVPIEAADAPNVFVSVTVLRGTSDSPREFPEPEFRYGYCQINVENPASRLAVAVNSGAEERRPGEAIDVAVEVKDAAAQPVAEAEVTLYAVDEGVLNLTGYDTPDPHRFFFQPRPLAVRSFLSLPNLFPEDPTHWRFSNKGFLVGGGGTEAARKNFLALAFWNANLRTDAAGRATARFSAPDSLTRYRVIAVVVGGADRFGSGESRVRINKPLMLDPALPRFANVGDRLIVRGVVHNQTTEAGEVEVTLRLDAAAKPDGENEPNHAMASGQILTRRTTVKAGGSAHIEFPLVFVQAGPAKWLWRGRFLDPLDAGVNTAVASNAVVRANRASFTDAVVSTLDVGYPVPLMREVHQARLDGSRPDLLAEVNPQLRGGTGRVVVRIANTRLNELGGAAEHLLHYPYGCVEQTSSSLLPWIVLRGAPAIAPKLTNSPAEFARAIRAGVERLFSMQTESGGLSYWPGGREPMLWGSAYGGMVVALAQRQGVAMSESKRQRLWHYLGERARGAQAKDGPVALSDRGLACYALALAGKPESAAHEQLFNRRAELSAEARSWLALAVAESKGPSSMTVGLLDNARMAPRAEGDWFGSETTDVALRLLASLKTTRDDATVERLVSELMRAQKEARWATTQGNAWGLLALAEYATRVETALRPTSGELRWGDERVAFSLSDKPTVVERVFTNRADLASAPLGLENPSGARLFTTVTVEARPTAWNQPRQDHGFSLTRRYARLNDDGAEQDGPWRVGDRVLIELALDAHEAARYVAIDDALPAVFEGLNPAFTSQAAGTAKTSADWFSDYREMRADRVLFFRDHLPAGRYVIRYLARVRAAGQATAPSAKVEAMYQPGRFGLSETAVLRSEAWE